MRTRRTTNWPLPESSRAWAIRRFSLLTIMTAGFITWVSLIRFGDSETLRNFRDTLQTLPRFVEVPVILNTQVVNNADKTDMDTLLYTDSDLAHILIFVRDPTAPHVSQLAQFFGQQKVKYRITALEDIQPLEIEPVPQYSLFVFDDFISYLSMPPDIKHKIDHYCELNEVGIFAFAQSNPEREIEIPADLGLKIQHRMKLQDFRLEVSAGIWRVAKPDAVYQGELPSQEWSIFSPSHTTYKPLAYSTVAVGWQGKKAGVSFEKFGCIVAILDKGLRDNIKKVIMGYDVSFWLNSIVAMDAITYLSNGDLALTLDRFLQVDIDGTFLGEPGNKLTSKDVGAMLESQRNIRKWVPGFRWVLGFSGAGFGLGTAEEIWGDHRLVELAEEFVWFNQLYQHEQPHLQNSSTTKRSMGRNMDFAEVKQIPIQRDYMVPPRNSGVYPIIDKLYDIWSKEGDMTSTSTDEYPRHDPFWDRRGFIYRDIMVLPRQTINFEDYKTDKAKLDASIQGGYLFSIFLSTPIMIFKTQFSDYANSHIALYTFEQIASFISQWTNLSMQTLPPAVIAKKYFEMYPHEIGPVWTNPCDNDRHLAMWNLNGSCDHFPEFLILGPQKTGTTALYAFLNAHPSLQSTREDPNYHEEVQFFSNDFYIKGVKWYMDHFRDPKPGVMQFEKSANYFDYCETPRRMFALLPNAKIIINLAEPCRRAYSWYQNMRSHADPVAMKHSFYEVITAPDHGSDKELRAVRNRCLRPGEYARVLDKWLQYYQKEQIFFVDGDMLKSKPVKVMNRVQKFIGVEPFIDYEELLRFDKKKGFYCVGDIEDREDGCLGPSKGRKYPAMDAKSMRFLQDHYEHHNERLRDQLRELGAPLPTWLKRI